MFDFGYQFNTKSRPSSEIAKLCLYTIASVLQNRQAVFNVSETNLGEIIGNLLHVPVPKLIYT